MRSCLALVVMVWGLMACAHPPQAQGLAVAHPPDRVTASDETPQARRARLHTELAYGYLARGQASVALDEAKLALRAESTYAPAWQVKFLAYQALAEPGLAMATLQQGLAQAPGDAALRLQHAGWLCLRDGTAALAAFDLAIDAGAGAAAWLGKARCIDRQGGDAAAALARARDQYPHDASIVLAWASYAAERQQWAQAHALLNPLNVGAAASAASLWLQADVYRRQGLDDQARLLQQRVREHFPNASEAARLRQE